MSLVEEGVWGGVDVGGRRKGFHATIVGCDGLAAEPEPLPTVADTVEWLLARSPKLVAVDSPISPAPDGCRSRECERDLRRAICGIRYTPERHRLDGNPYYEWILHGLELHAAIEGAGLAAIECFPTASFTRWAGARGSKTRAAWSRDTLAALGFDGVRRGQDGRDAVAAALTACCYDGGDAECFGDIVVPKKPAP